MKQKIKLLGTVFLMLSCFSSPAQKVKPLSMGDHVPDISFKLVNGSSTQAKLSDYRGKLVILDFWATWCGACISSFPKMDSVQQKHKDKLVLLLVNSIDSRDSETRINGFFKTWKNKNGHAYPIPSAVGDTVATRLFPHRFLPHYVWISPKGIVKAITVSDDLSEKNIEKALQDEAIVTPLKKDFFDDMPLYLGEDTRMNELTAYSLFLKGKINGVKELDMPRVLKYNNKNKIRGRAMRNLPLLDMYKAAIGWIMPDYNNDDNRIILQMTDSSGLVYDPSKSSKEDWEKDNLYTCDILLPGSKADSLYYDLLGMLNKNSGYNGRVEKRMVKSLVLVRTDTADRIKTKGGKLEYRVKDAQAGYVKNLSVSYLVNGLSQLKWVNIPVTDETNYRGKIDIDFSAEDIHDLPAMKSALKRYGLDLKETERELNMFVLRIKEYPETVKTVSHEN